MKVKWIILFIIVFVTLLIAWYKTGTLPEIQSSHIDANVPDEKEFDSILRRDLIQYFSHLEKGQVQIHYELLRKGATQSGIAYPKFYLWVKVIKNGEVIQEGAVRVAAIAGKEFQVTDHLRKQEIQEYPEKVCQVFPKALCDKIIEKAKA